MIEAITRQKLLTVGFVMAVFSSLSGLALGELLEEWHFGVVASVIALVVWITCHRHYRALADTPCAPISSAPQGYIEIEGIGRQLGGTPLLSPVNCLPCLWFRVLREKRDSEGWERESEDVSDTSFILRDDDGSECVVDPEGAKVIASHKDVITESNYRTTQWLLIPGTRIHAIGYFRTDNQATDRPSEKAELRDLLANWKDSGETMRFDADGNGELSMEEWEQARHAALQAVRKQRLEAASLPDLHRLVAPSDGRSFIITDQDSDKIARNYRWGAIAALVAFFVAIAGTGWLWAQR